MTESIDNPNIYLERMAKPIQEKLKVARYIPVKSQNVLDVGCADGVVTSSLAKIFPQAKVLGIDLNEGFVSIAKERWQDLLNLEFERVYLRDLLARPMRYDVVVFCSVLHEFFTYGEGISSVVKALADAHELLRPGGRVIIRDMILFEYFQSSNLNTQSIIDKIYTHASVQHLQDFEDQFGKLSSINSVNHYLLKYLYVENWEREGRENYVPVTFEQYEEIFKLLGMRLGYLQSYLIPYLKDRWQQDFDLSEDEIEGLRSTGILVAEKA